MNLLYLVLLVCSGIVLLFTAIEGQGGEVVHIKTCLNVSSKAIAVTRLKSYKEQTIPIKAIMFTTKKDVILCADPEEKWVKKAVECLKARNKKAACLKKKSNKKKNRKGNKKNGTRKS